MKSVRRRLSRYEGSGKRAETSVQSACLAQVLAQLIELRVKRFGLCGHLIHWRVKRSKLVSF
jgi:hypothetical protein